MKIGVKKAIACVAFWLLSFTWGILATLVGAVAAAAAICIGGKPEANGVSIIVRIGKDWGGVSLGAFALCSEESFEHVRKHEFGHSIQNCAFGPLWPLIVGLPSAVRYWVFEWRRHRGKQNPEYDSVWFEGTATKWGTRFVDWWETNENTGI